MTAAGLGRAGDPSGGAGDALSIGSVLDALRADFPEITISKIRFLESEGLISPSRTPAGYRQFDHADVERLRFVLSAQRDHYLPLKVIRAKLEEFDRNPDAGDPSLDDTSATTTASTTTTAPPPPAAPVPGGPTGPGGPGPAGPSRRGGITERRGLSSVLGGGGGGGGGYGGGGGHGGDGPGGSGSSDPDGPAGGAIPGGALITREALLDEDGVDEQLLAGLEHHGILRADLSGRFEPEAPVVVRTAAALARLGVEPRLLRGARASADREVGLLTQLLTPVARSRAPESGRRAEELSTELASLSGRLHALLVGAGLRSELRR